MEGYIQVILTFLAAVVSAFWAAYRWFVTRPKDKADKELRKQELDIVRQQLEIEKEFPYIEFDIEVDLCKQGDQRALLVHARATNKGRRVAQCIVVHDEVLTIAKVLPNGDGTSYMAHQYAQYVKLDHGTVESWSITTIVPGATKTFPFVVFVNSPGIYYAQVKLRMNEESEKEVRERCAFDVVKPVYWSGSCYVHVSD